MLSAGEMSIPAGKESGFVLVEVLDAYPVTGHGEVEDEQVAGQRHPIGVLVTDSISDGTEQHG